MKQLILCVSFLYLGACVAQTIDLEPVTTPSQFQDADVGSMAFGDVDNDGDNDLMITGKGGPVKSTLYRNDGAGNFSEVTGTPFVNLFGGTTRFADVDNDGDLDLMMTGSDSRPVRHALLYLNDSTGNFSLAAGTPFQANWGGDFDFADVDKDGDLDVLMTGVIPQVGNDPEAGFATLYLNDGLGTFTEVMGTPFESVRNSSVAFIDIDNDNDQDVIIAGENNMDNPVTRLYINDSTGNFSLVANTVFENIHSGDIAIADSDKDGDLDVLISGQSNNGTISHLYINNGSGSFSLLAGTPFPGTMVGASDFADFDMDGDMDVLIVGAGNAIVSNIYENRGANQFVLADSLAGAYLASIAIGDMDGDKDPDLVIGGTSFTAPVRSTKVYINLTPIRTAVDRDEKLQSVHIFPNPSEGELYIQLTESFSASVSIYSTNGQLVYADEDLHAANNRIVLDQPAGLYIVVVRTKGVTTTRRVVLR